ncbi:HPr family phosphocarrier protein [Shewanella sp. NIFS-20-20]|uniref:HPr family phosphocarrier protein n=1 Tax=Shewanella sp. NIFS-20-20 TaxID=2853806 RepID=UPI001C44C873|nr:HPr family phosphocarrier protein [Shewanella sp. NIFS-20-20]MBV7316149.1 HPr family phosphocarrier protein [Shewanella sp. NIFS-20-20]
MPVLERQVTLCNKLGLHARPATKLAILASEYQADITLIQGDKHASAASVLGLLMLGSGPGKPLLIRAEGEDAEAAMEAICALINARFDEND